MKVRLLKGYAEDRRQSMDIYAERLYQELTHRLPDVALVQPHSALEQLSHSKFVMRYLRYVAFPRWVGRPIADLTGDQHIAHILDHGYAHLIKSIKLAAGDRSKTNSTKVCVTVHDLIPLLAWEGRLGTQHKGRKPALAMHSANHLRQADMIFSVSHSTANDLMELLEIPARKIEVVPAPIPDEFCRVSDSSIRSFRERFALSNDYFWILVSGSEFYKDHESVVGIFRELRGRKLPVKILKTGLEGLSESSPLRQLDQDDVKVISLDSSELAALYSSVDCVLFPSLYEGFGFPVVEALACGTPVVCSDAASLPEVGGELARICKVGDTGEMAREIEAIYSEGHPGDILASGPKWVQQFRASTVAKRFTGYYTELQSA